jgi:release factor glutamine methyltransferase
MSSASQKKKKTPDYFHCIEDKRLRDAVYEPEADTFVFLDGLDKDEAFLVTQFPKGVCVTSPAAVPNKQPQRRARRFLEVGCGSGTVISHLESILGWTEGDEYHVVDINPVALEAAEMTWGKSVEDCPPPGIGKPPLHRHLGDLFAPFSSNVSAAESSSAGTEAIMKGCSALSTPLLFDVVLFNPPYVPTSSEELDKAIEGNDVITAAWCGGPKGRVVVDRFLRDLPKFLDPVRGVAYVIAIKENDVEDMIRYICDNCGFANEMDGCRVEASVVFRRYTSEDLSLIKIQRSVAPGMIPSDNEADLAN